MNYSALRNLTNCPICNKDLIQVVNNYNNEYYYCDVSDNHIFVRDEFLLKIENKFFCYRWFFHRNEKSFFKIQSGTDVIGIDKNNLSEVIDFFKNQEILS